MKRLRILHSADFHIGMRFRDYSCGEQLREARLSAVDRVVAAANERECDILTVGGDLFERRAIPKADVRRVTDSLARFAGVAVLVLPGNHDYIGGESSLWSEFRESSPDHVYLLSDPEPFDLRPFALDAVVFPAPCDAKHSETNRIGWVAERLNGGETVEGDTVLLGLAHGSIEGVSPDFAESYFPMTRAELEGAGVDLWLMGHSHVTWPPAPDPRERIVNPGTPEPDGFDCSHAGHALYVELGGRGRGGDETHTAPGERAELGGGGRGGDEAERVPATGRRDGRGASPGSRRRVPSTIEVVQTGMYRFHREHRTLRGIHDVQRVGAELGASSLAKTAVRLILDGRLDTEAMEALPGALERVRANVLEIDLRRDDLHEAITPERIDREYAAGSFAARLLHELAQAQDHEALEEAWETLRECAR